MLRQTVGTQLRKSGIGVVGDVPWGSHFCMFYETKEDLLDMLVPYFKAGLENKEVCLWVVSEPLTEEEAENALQEAVPEFDRYLADFSIEIREGRRFYLPATSRTWTGSSEPGRRKRIPHWTGDMPGFG